MKRLIMDLDDTICSTSKGDYENSKPNQLVIEKLGKYKSEGFEIVIHTSRNMRTYNGNVGKINIHTLPNVINWLKKNNVPYDEIIIGKPWCGFEGFYVDDKSIRPSEFIAKTYAEIQLLLDKEKNK
tara:strand:- start:159 stop:536 length:378 start_codon:yes stop_codon:yes gene_type:complete